MIKYYWSLIVQSISRLVVPPTDLNTDVAKIRNSAPLHHVILDPDIPVEVTPGVYVFHGCEIGERRVRRYQAWLSGNQVHIELWK